MNELFGCDISYLYIDKEQQYLAFITFFKKIYLYYADGDCCSHSWFESINNPENIIDSEIIGIEKKEIITGKENDDNSVIAFGYTLKTNKGYTDIEFRNESNGYYGGSCILIPEKDIQFENEITREDFSNKKPIIIKVGHKKITLDSYIK